jgi:hypothetical protein
MTYEIRTVSEFLEHQNEERSIRREDVLPRVLHATVWQAIVSFPGCLGDSHSVARSREDALASVEYWLGEDDYSPRYVRGLLRRFGVCYLRDGRVITLGTNTIGDLF